MVKHKYKCIYYSRNNINECHKKGDGYECHKKCPTNAKIFFRENHDPGVMHFHFLNFYTYATHGSCVFFISSFWEKWRSIHHVV